MTRSFEILSEFLLIKGTSDIVDKGRMDYCRFFQNDEAMLGAMALCLMVSSQLPLTSPTI